VTQVWLHLYRRIYSADDSRHWTRPLLLALADVVAVQDGDPLLFYVRGWPEPLEIEEQSFAALERSLAEYGCWIL
jgi:hypothetical protein